MPRTAVHRRWSVIALNRTGMRAPAISSSLGFQQRAVYGILSRLAVRPNEVKDLPRSGRPCKGMCQQWLQTGLSWHLRRLNAQKYTDHILGPHVEPHIDNHVLADRVVFMQDGASPHAARVIEGFLANEAIDVLLWPTKGPDIDIIESIWSFISRGINGMNPLPQNTTELHAAVHSEWQNVTHARIRRWPALHADLCHRGGSRWTYQLLINSWMDFWSCHYLCVKFSPRLKHYTHSLIHVKRSILKRHF